VVLACGRQVFVVDVMNREVTRLLDNLASPIHLLPDLSRRDFRRFASTPAPPLGTPVSIHGAGAQAHEHFQLYNDDALYLLNFGAFGRREPLAMRLYPLPAEARGHGFLYSLWRDGKVVIAVSDLPEFGARAVRQRTYPMDADGTPRPSREFEVPRLPDDWHSWRWAGIVPLASPLALAVESAAGGLQSWHDYAGMTGPGDYARAVWWRDRAPLAAVCLISAVLAAVCYRRQVRYRASVGERIVWPLLVFLLGIPGWLGYRHGRRWLVLVPCPACQHPVPRAGELCTACDHEFPQPAASGAEIFA
jgi:hypothetical protein